MTRYAVVALAGFGLGLVVAAVAIWCVGAAGLAHSEDLGE